MAAQSPTAAVTVVIPHYGDPAPTLALVDRLLSDPGDALAAVVVSGVTAARTQRALRLRETPPARLTRADAVPVAVMLAVVALVVAPILTLVVRSFHTRLGWGLGN